MWTRKKEKKRDLVDHRTETTETTDFGSTTTIGRIPKKTNQIRNQLFSNSPSQTQTKGIARTFGMMRTSHIHTNTNVE